jgi:hypothetical protein
MAGKEARKHQLLQKAVAAEVEAPLEALVPVKAHALVAIREVSLQAAVVGLVRMAQEVPEAAAAVVVLVALVAPPLEGEEAVEGDMVVTEGRVASAATAWQAERPTAALGRLA